MKNKNALKCFVGVNALDEIASKDARICVMNILGNESKKVTPVSHEFSGGNVVAGVQYGRAGKLETAIGDIPVYSRLADVMKNHAFDTGVIYLPPDAVYHAVGELCHYNKKLKKIVIITEKISVKDQRLIRTICQVNKVDVFGANCLGVADSWNRVRIGGALGGDRPDETLIKGSLAIHSNSGNFSTTIAEYLKTEGFGTTTIVSSGKDVIIQFAMTEFLYAVQNDPRTKAVVLYVEPGGYYEREALAMIESGNLVFKKPIIVCVTGRWKSNLTRSCGHAGALAGSGDDALAKEKWFDDYFGGKEFDPAKPGNISKKGVRVSSIQQIPLAAKALYKKLGWGADFEAKGSLGLKPWFGNDFGLNLPLELRLPTVEAIAPYNEEIASVNKQLGVTHLRQNMRNKSGASRINAATQVAELHNVPIVELISYPLESNILFTLIKSHPEKELLPLVNICLNYLAYIDEFESSVLSKAKENQATPNAAIASVIALQGNNKIFRKAQKYMGVLLSTFSTIGLRDINDSIDLEMANKVASNLILENGDNATGFTNYLNKKVDGLLRKSPVLQFGQNYLEKNGVEDANLFMIVTVLLHTSFQSLVYKKISRETVENLLSYLTIMAKAVMLTSINPDKNKLLKAIRMQEDFSVLETSFAETAYQAIFNERPQSTNLKEFSSLLALTLTNGPGTISAKGAKESVSARNNISAAFVGFLTNTGLSHGGNGYEAVKYLLNAFKDLNIDDPAKPFDADVLKELASKKAREFLDYKNQAKLKGVARYNRIPCINHPVFKGKRVNIDPREDFIRKRLKSENIENVCWDYYHYLVEALYAVGATSNIYCVNIDAVIAVISLKLMWPLYKNGTLKESSMQDIGFLIFLIGRTVGVSAEIADHRDRGQDMDCRTPIKETKYVV